MAYLADFCTLQDAVGDILRLLLQRRGHRYQPKTCENAPSICSRKEARTRSAASAKSLEKKKGRPTGFVCCLSCFFCLWFPTEEAGIGRRCRAANEVIREGKVCVRERRKEGGVRKRTRPGQMERLCSALCWLAG